MAIYSDVEITDAYLLVEGWSEIQAGDAERAASGIANAINSLEGAYDDAKRNIDDGRWMVISEAIQSLKPLIAPLREKRAAGMALYKELFKAAKTLEKSGAEAVLNLHPNVTIVYVDGEVKVKPKSP